MPSEKEIEEAIEWINDEELGAYGNSMAQIIIDAHLSMKSERDDAIRDAVHWKWQCDENVAAYDRLEAERDHLYELLENERKEIIRGHDLLDKLEAERDMYKNKSDDMVDIAYDIEVDRDKYKAIVEDFANHGTRHDLNPTMHFTGDEMEMAKWCIKYMKSMDNYVRTTAKNALVLREKES